MLKKAIFLFIVLILVISCRKPFRPTLSSLGAPPTEPDSPVIDETPEESYIVKAEDTEEEIENKIQKYYEENQEYAVIVEDTGENIEANDTIKKINNVISKDNYSQGVSLDLSKTTITKIDNNAFNGNKYLYYIMLPETLISIGEYAFANAKKLTLINFPSSLTTVGNGAFLSCTSLEYVNLKNTKINILSAQVFNSCNNLRSIELPDGLITIKNSAFAYCISLEGIAFPENFEAIEEFVFGGCGKLKKVNFNSKLKSINHYAFYDCTSLSSISLPSSLEQLGDVDRVDIFPDCTSLLNVEYLGTDPKAITSFGNVFGTSNPQNLYLPNVQDPALAEVPPKDPNPWESFLGYDWANKIQYETSMPSN